MSWKIVGTIPRFTNRTGCKNVCTKSFHQTANWQSAISCRFIYLQQCLFDKLRCRWYSVGIASFRHKCRWLAAVVFRCRRPPAQMSLSAALFSLHHRPAAQASLLPVAFSLRRLRAQTLQRRRRLPVRPVACSTWWKLRSAHYCRAFSTDLWVLLRHHAGQLHRQTQAEHINRRFSVNHCMSLDDIMKQCSTVTRRA